MIFKLQWPLDATPGAPIMAYSIRRKDHALLPPSPELAALFAGRVKIFVECNVVDGILEIGDEVPDPGW
jgi:hypothetical protein